MRRFRDRDFIQTREGFFFCVVGPFHPSDRVISYLKYVPAKLGVWGRGKKRFKRVMRTYTIPSLLETFSALRKDHPHYLFCLPLYNVKMTAVPHTHIAKHFKPEEKLAQLHSAKRLDSLQGKLMRFERLNHRVFSIQSHSSTLQRGHPQRLVRSQSSKLPADTSRSLEDL